MSLESGEVPTLKVEGPMTIDEVARHREAWRSSLAQAGRLRIDLGASGPWDVAGLQLVLSALASGDVRIADAPSGLRELAERAAVLDRLDAAAV